MMTQTRTLKLKQKSGTQLQVPPLGHYLLIYSLALLCLPALGWQPQKEPRGEETPPGAVGDKSSFVRLDRLPDQFTNDKISAGVSPGDTCYNLIGCFEAIPATTWRQEPAKLKTEFRLYSRETAGSERPPVAVVKFEPRQQCLEENTDECDTFPYDLSALSDRQLYKPARRTIIIIGGYFSKAPSSWEIRIKDLWLALADVNVIIVGWTGGNRGLYNVAAVNTRIVGRQLTVLLYYLATLNEFNVLDEALTERLYLIGHSLGAHIAAFTGQDLQRRVGRITGLEPAGPLFDKLDARFRLDASDAQLVDALHTNAGASLLTESQYGTGLQVAHLDVYANDGQHQPGCGNDRLGCSHKKAPHYYEQFLNHTLAMRQIALNGSRFSKQRGARSADGAAAAAVAAATKRHRLFAYASLDYDDFCNGQCFQRRCANLTTDELHRCSVPVDYVAWFDELKGELQQDYGFSFDELAEATVLNDKYFFLTTNNQHQPQDQLPDHYVMSMAFQSATSAGGGGNDDDDSDGKCNLSFEIEMSNGLSDEVRVKQFKLVHKQKSHQVKQVAHIPFVAVDSASKYELAQLDLLDFYLANSGDGQTNDDNKTTNQTRKLTDTLLNILPASIIISGLTPNKGPDANATSASNQTAQQQSKRKNLADFFANLYNIASGAADSRSCCNLSLISFSVLPLRRMQRTLVASYSLDDSKVSKPTITVLGNSQSLSEQAAAVDLFKSKEYHQQVATTGGNLKLFLTSILIGERDESSQMSAAASRFDLDLEWDLPTEEMSIYEASAFSANTWLILTLALCSLVICVAAVSTVRLN